MKIQLVQPTTGAYQSNSRSGCYVPLGLVSIATFVAAECPGTHVEILDGELLTRDEIIDALDADIVGINANTVTYPEALRVAEAAKARGAYVVLGGVFPSAIPELILEHRRHLVDTIVVGYGEEPMKAIIGGARQSIVRCPLPRFDVLPIPDRRFAKLETYLERFRARHPTWDYRGTNLFTNVGCTWRDESRGGCIFCSRSGPRATFRTPESVWTEVRELVERYGIEYLVDFSDTSLQNVEWFRALVEARPRDLAPRWHIFSRIDEITPETIELVQRLSCDRIFIGVESGDPVRYRQARKGGGSPSEVLEKAALLTKAGIRITPSYVMGLPGEDNASLENTIAHARRLHEITGFEEVFCCPLIPFPGSLAYEQLRQRRRITSDLLDVDELKEMWASDFCEVDASTLTEYANQVLALAPYRITIQKTAHPGAAAPGDRDEAVLVGTRKRQFTCV